MRRKLNLIYILSFISIGFAVISFSGIAQSDQSLNESFLKAIYAKDFSLMEKLLKEGLDINASLRDGTSTPLAEAAYLGDLAVIDYLLSKGAKVEGNQTLPNSPMFFAILEGHLAVVSRFLDLGVDPNYAWPNRDGGTLLIAAVQFGQLDVVKLLVQRGAKVNFCGNGNFSPLFRSIIYDRFSIFKGCFSCAIYQES